MVVQHNLRAMNSNRMLGLTQSQQAKSSEKLSSGYKINRAADDAAGLSISEKMRKQIRGLTQASLNAQDGISAVQTAEGALHEVQDMLQRMNELAVKAANGTMSEDDRGYIQDEIDQLITEIDRVSETTKFNESYLLKGDKEESDLADVSAIVGGTVQEATVVEAKGNIYSNQFVSTAANKLAEGTSDTATIKYKDENGNVRTKDIIFEVGATDSATASNFVEAINKDEELNKIFTARVDGNGRFEIESISDGTQTDSTKNTLVNAGAIVFKSASNGGQTRVNDLATDDGTIEEATTGAYAVKIGTGTAAAASTVTLNLVDGESITIDGKTYTYDANKNAASAANSFKTLGDLQNLIGDNYELDVKVVGKLKEDTQDANNVITDSKTSDFETSLKTDATTAAKAIGALAAADFATTFNNTTFTQNQAGTAKTFSELKVTLNITRKAEVEKEVNALHFSLQVGADTTEENKISIDIQSMSAKSLGISKVRVDGTDSKNADAAVGVIAEAIQKVSTQRSALGAVQNRLEHTINNLDNVVENTTAAESQIRDTDMATEMVKFSNNNILAQAGQAMLAQSNQANQGVLALLQ